MIEKKFVENMVENKRNIKRYKEIIQYNPEIKEDEGAIKCQSTVINCFLNKIFICYISRTSCCEENTFVIINIRIGWLKHYRSLTNHRNRIC